VGSSLRSGEKIDYYEHRAYERSPLSDETIDRGAPDT
jgi:hypothetical protein